MIWCRWHLGPPALVKVPICFTFRIYHCGCFRNGTPRGFTLHCLRISTFLFSHFTARIWGQRLTVTPLFMLDFTHIFTFTALIICAHSLYSYVGLYAIFSFYCTYHCYTCFVSATFSHNSWCRNISARIKRNGRHLRKISRVIAKGLNTYANVIFQTNNCCVRLKHTGLQLEIMGPCTAYLTGPPCSSQNLPVSLQQLPAGEERREAGSAAEEGGTRGGQTAAGAGAQIL